jgi:sirohydrochlorin cobaltochelatase
MTTRIPVIGLAHGSRHPQGRTAIEALMAAVAEQGAIPAGAAYLDLAEPDLETVVRDLAAAGHRAAIVVPLLFTSAFHATVDVPQTVREAADAVGLELQVADILGTGEEIAELVLDGMTAARIDDRSSVLLFAVGSSNPSANAAVANLADRLAQTRTGAVRAGFGTCDPRGSAVAEELTDPVAVVPLFLADGLLMDPIRALAGRRGWSFCEPIGDRAAGVVLHRYATARTAAQLR